MASVKRRVVITGIGIIAPNGETTELFWNNCLLGNAVVSHIPLHWKQYVSNTCTVWAPLPPLNLSSALVNRIERLQLDMVSILGLNACMQALNMSGFSVTQADVRKNTFHIAALDARRCGVCIGTGIAGVSSFAANQAFHCMYELKQLLNEHTSQSKDPNVQEQLKKTIASIAIPARFNPFVVSMTMPNSIAASIGIKFSLNGQNMTFCNACSSGTVAIGQATRLIQSGDLDVVIAGGAEYLADEYGGIFRGFDSAKTLIGDCSDPLKANRPFDVKRSGFLFAEGGAALLILESLEHAQKRNAIPLAEVCGFSQTFDAHSMMAIDPKASAITELFSRVVADAGCTFSQIDYINAHGTGTVQNDDIESLVLQQLFTHKPLINSTKSLIGHTIGAAGAIEAAVTALSLKNQTTHGCHNLEIPVRDLNFVRKKQECALTYGLSHSFAFGGHNAALILKRYEP